MGGCEVRAVPRIAARHTTTHNYSVTDDVLAVGTTEVPELGIRNAKRFETTVLWDCAPHETVTRNTKRDETYVLHDWAPCEAPSSVLGRAEEKSSMPPPPPRQGVWAATTTIALVRR